MTAHAFAALSAAGVLLLAGCGAEDNGPPSRLLPPVDFAAAIARPGTVTINVHVPDEGSIRGTDLWIPFDAVEARRDELPPPATPLAVYCRSGRMSAVAWERNGRRLLPVECQNSGPTLRVRRFSGGTEFWHPTRLRVLCGRGN